jgi:hypothetical protein
MKRTLFSAALVLALLAAASVATIAQRGGAPAPSLQVNPLWPEPLPNHWVLGSVTGVSVDAKDHVWVTHRGADSLEGGEKGMMLNPPTSSQCCTAAPFVLHFDADGKLVSNFGGPGQGYHPAGAGSTPAAAWTPPPPALPPPHAARSRRPGRPTRTSSSSPATASSCSRSARLTRWKDPTARRR